MDAPRLRARYLAALGVPGLCAVLACDPRGEAVASPHRAPHPGGTDATAPTPAPDAAVAVTIGRRPMLPGRSAPPDGSVGYSRGRRAVPPSTPADASAPSFFLGHVYRPGRTTPGRALAAAAPRDVAPVVAGEFAVAPCVARDDWRDAALDLDADGLPRDARDALAASWRAIAASEHASVAAFARESLRLAAHAAPPALLIEAHAAALDEVRHARIAYALASRFAGGEPVGPGPLGGVDAAAVSLAQLARDAFLAGALNEAASAQVLREAAHATSIAPLRAALVSMADDEERHAEFAFRTLAWAVRAGGAPVVAALRDALAEARAHASSGAPAVERAHEALLSGHGSLHPAVEGAVYARVLREVVAPCLEALLSSA